MSESLDSCIVKNAQHLAPYTGFYLALRVEAVIYLAQELAEDIGIETKGVVE